MIDKLKRYQQPFIVILIAVCLMIITAGGLSYISKLRKDLEASTIQSLMTATVQQQQAFDAFIETDREELRDFVDFFTRNGVTDPEQVRQLLTLPSGEDALYLVACLEEGWTCSTSVDDIRQLEEEDLDTYRALEGSGVRGPYTGLYSRTPRFGYYETFSFRTGHPGIILKSYDRSRVLAAVSLSFYNDQGFSYVIDQNGDILLRPAGDGDFNENIFEMLAGEAEAGRFEEELAARKTGTIALGGDVYTYVPVACVEDWYLVSVVPESAVQEETAPVLGEFQISLGMLLLVLFVCAIFLLMFLRKQMELRAKDKEIAEQQRLAQDSLTEALRMAQAASDAKSAFLSNVSHDIRTPMNAIIGFLALMRDEVDNPETVMEYNKRIDAASQHLLGLINDVLDMNKIESGSATLSIAEMSLADIIREINSIIRPQAWAKDQGFDIKVSQLQHEHLLGDKLRINQILINLLSNAVKYTPAGGDLCIHVEELPQVMDEYSRIRFTVSDNGLGMSEEYLKVIFDPFTREDTAVTHEIQGTGLGMAITKSLVDLMGGSIRVESEPGQGTTFTVELELRIQEQEDDPKFWAHHRVTRMIVVDDEEEVCKNIVKTMVQAGVEADYATDGETAVRMMRENREAGRPYDLILLDGKMPGPSGLETARLIRRNYSEKIPILLLTSYDWSDIEEEAMELGITHFMSKPFFISTFKDAIRRVMGSRKHADAIESDVVRGMNILVVDDIEVNRIILVKILTSLGAACDTASNGQEAVERFEASTPGQYDLILMDVQMPVLDGYGATRTIRASSHPSAGTMPIIAMTANAFVDDVRDAIDSGMDAHIAKPVQIDTLKATIQQVLDARKV